MDHLDDLTAVALDAPIWQWTIMGPQDEAGLRRWLETALANAEAGIERPFATIDLASGARDREQPLPLDRPRAPAPGDRLDVGRDGIPADRRQSRGEAAPAVARLRDPRGEPGRVQDPQPQRALPERPRRDRRHLRGGLPQPHDRAGRLDPGLGLLQRDRPRMARSQGPAGGQPGPLTRVTFPVARLVGRDILAARHRRHIAPRRSNAQVHHRDRRDGDHVRDRLLPAAADRLQGQHPHADRDLDHRRRRERADRAGGQGPVLPI